MIAGQVAAIVWAQWRSILNYQGGGRRRRFPITTVFAVIWYGMWSFAAYAIAVVAAAPENMDLLERALPVGLFAVSVYWQVVPIMMASSGLSLDLARLRVYPVPHVQLFAIEVLLRITTSLEMVIITGGLAAGLAVNPRVPFWALLGLVIFSLLNLFFSAGLRDLFTRLMARKGLREAAIFFMVLLAASPQLLLSTSDARSMRDWLEGGFGWYWPWSAASAIALGRANAVAALLLLAWTAAAYAFSRWQFERSLHSDTAESQATSDRRRRSPYLLDVIARVPRTLLRDPLAALIEKEVRTLGRAPRFRLLFLMGFSFGLLIWLPIAMRGDPESPLTSNYLTIVSAYALMLLGEICFWNSFGMDRWAAQTYFVMPVDFRTVIVAKNLAAAFFILVELTMVTIFCLILRMPVSVANVVEAFSVTAVLGLFMISMGNLLSTRYPRSVNPAQSWRSGSMSRVQAYLLLIYPLVAIPIFLAYGARYAFETDLALYATLAVDVILGLILYFVTIDSAVDTTRENKEQFLTALSSGEGPVG